MITRTTIALDFDLLTSLKKIVKEKKKRSVSSVIKDAITNYIAEYQKQKLYREMERDYQWLAKHTDDVASRLFQQASWEDINRLYPNGR